MPCYKPVAAQVYLSGRTGRQAVRMLQRAQAHLANSQLPCGHCIGCRLEKAKQWALRCHHESTQHPENSFVTLTYAEDHLPKGGTLVKSDFQKFIRALRQATGQKIRYYMCGEYGDETKRPHYHALLFGIGFDDKYLWTVRRGNNFYRSPTLERYWTLGNSDISEVNFTSAGYVARYLLQKQNGEFAMREYAILDAETGEITGYRLPPYNQMSLKPGIGATWYEKHKADLFPHDFAVLPDGRETTTPKYYRELLRRENPTLAEKLREKRVAKALENTDNTPERLHVREKCKQAKTKRLVRQL